MDPSSLDLDLQRLRDLHLFRSRRVFNPIDATHVECDGKKLIHFCSNDYLGFSHHPRIIRSVQKAVEKFGFGSGAAPLITGYTPAHASFETALAKWKGVESAILLPSGYQANLTAIQTAAAIGQLQGGVRFLIDKLCHASLIDAVRGTAKPFRVFPHNGIAKLRRLLETAAPGELQVVVTESIFSMDGDAADLAALAELKQEHGFFLVLDEAHATGVYGPGGSGLARELSLQSIVDISVLTLSKAMGGIGGAVCSSRRIGDALINHARAYLFSTAVPAATAVAGETAIEIMQQEPARQARLRDLAKKVRAEMASMGIEIPAGDSPIVPVILGDEKAAIDGAEKLLRHGLLVMPVRPPTVPP